MVSLMNVRVETMALIGTIFKCTACGHNGVEEILVNAVVSTEVIMIASDGHKVYGDHSIMEGDVEEYRCSGCGVPVDLDKLLESEN